MLVIDIVFFFVEFCFSYKNIDKNHNFYFCFIFISVSMDIDSIIAQLSPAPELDDLLTINSPGITYTRLRVSFVQNVKYPIYICYICHRPMLPTMNQMGYCIGHVVAKLVR